MDLAVEKDLMGVSALVRAAATPPRTISPAARRRMRGRLYASLVGRGASLHPRLRLALVLSFTLAVGGVVGAATHAAILKRMTPDPGVQAPAPREAQGKHKVSQRPRRASPMPAAVPMEQASAALAPEQPASTEVSEGSPSPLPAASPVAETVRPEVAPPAPASPQRPAQLPQRLAMAAPRSTPTQRPVATASPRTTPAPDGNPASVVAPATPTPTESTLLAQAIRALRVDGDAMAALKVLDERHARFTEGSLGPEAAAVRIEALLRLGRTDTALADLERMPLHAMPRRDEWHVVRGELRAQAGRWPSAEADFTLVLSGSMPRGGADLAERSLWGRSVARSHQGNVAGARADTREYLQRFPNGRFAGLAHRALLGP